MNDWMTYNSVVLKALRRKYESLWHKTRITVYIGMLYGCKKQLVRVNMRYCKIESQTAMVIRKKLFKIVDTLLGQNKQTSLLKYDSPWPPL